MQSIDVVNKMVSDHKSYMDKYLEDVSTAIKKYFAEFFHLHPEIPKITWTQCNYWNDGNSTNFGTEFSHVFRDEDEYEEEEEEEIEYTEEMLNLEKEVEKFLSAIPDEIYIHMFGEDVKITITKDGFDVEDYDSEY